jgi:hypothetical protein
MAGVALHAIQAAGMNGHDGALHVDEIVFAQYLVLCLNIAMSVPQGARSRNSLEFLGIRDQ